MGVYDYDVPDFLNVDASDAVKSILDEPVAPYTPPPEPVAQEGEFVKGVKRGMEGLKSAGYGAAGLIGSGLGIDALRDWGYEGFQEHEEEAAKHAGRVQNIEDIKSIGDVGDWAAGTFGSLVPSIGEAAVTSAAGAIVGSAIGPEGTIGGAVTGLVGKQAAKSMMRKLARGYVKDGMERQVAKEAAKKAVESLPAKALMRNLGTKAGIVAGTAPIEAGGMWGEGMQQGKDNPYSAAVFGTLSGLSELLGGEAELIDVFTNPARQAMKGNILKRVGVELGKTIPQEAGQEATQEILAIINRKAVDPSYDMFGEDARSRVLNSAAAGALGGVAFGGVGGVMSGKSSERGTGAEEESSSPQPPAPEIDPWKAVEEPPHPVTAAEAEEQPVISEAPKGPLTRAAEAGAATIPSIGDVTAVPVSPIGTVPNIGEVVPIIESTRTTDELVLDDARDWAQKQIAAGKTQLMRQTQEAQNTYNQRLIDEYRKSTATPSMPDSGPKYANVQLVNPETGKAEVVKPEEVADRLSKGWREQGQERAPSPQPPATESILSTVTDADRDALRMAQLRADYWERGSVDNGRSNKTQLFPWLNTWGKTTPAEVGKAIGNFLKGKKLGDVQRRLVEATLEFERENPVPFADEKKDAQSEKTQEEVRGQGEKRQVTLSEGERKKAEMYAEKAGIDLEGWPNEDIAGFVKQYDAWRFAERQKEHITQKLRATKDPKARERLQKTLEQVRQRQEKLISKGAADVEETADIQGTSGETATGAETVPPVPELDGQPGAGMPVVQPADEIEAYSVPSPQPPAPNKGGVQSGLSEVQEEELGKEEEVSAVRGETVETKLNEQRKAKFAEARRKHILRKLAEAKEPKERERLQKALARLEAERDSKQGKTEEKAEVEKQPWEMTREEFVKTLGMDEKFIPPQPKREAARIVKREDGSVWQTGEHGKAVYKALRKGKPVSPEVLAEYPELQKTSETKPATTPTTEKERPAEAAPPAPEEKASNRERFKAAQVRHIRKKLAEAQTEKEKERYAKLLEKLQARKPEVTTATTSIDDELQNISLDDFSSLVDDVAAEVRVEQAPPVDDKARRAAQFRKVRREHIKRKLAEAKEPRERVRLKKALEKLSAGKTAVVETIAGEKPEKDNGVESYFKKGQRVQLSDGTHGKVSEVTSYVMRSALLDISRHGGVGVTESKEEHNHMYSVRLDNGVETRAWYGNMFPETDPAPDVVPAPVYKGDAVDPGALLRSIQDDRNTARGKRAAASRAKKRENIDGHNRAADSYERQSAEKQAAFDAWADRYPEEAAKYRPKVEEKQAEVPAVSEANPRMSLKETVHSKKGHKLFVVVLNERVERDVYDRMNRDAKRTGNGYSSYRGHGAIPGFQFLDKGAAEEFMQRWGAASEGTTAETETPAAESKEQAQAESFNIGDEVYPVRDKDILKPGVVQHIQRDQYGKERIKVSNNGNAHWEVTDFAKQTQAIETPEQTRSAADILKDAALQGKEGMGEIVTGLYELFGGASLKSFPGAIDETTYAKAKPHFQAALEKFRASGEGIREFLRFLLEQFDPGIKPYLMRFVAELKGETFEEVKPGLTDGAQSDKLLNEEHQTKGKGDGNELSEDSSRPDGSEGSRGTEGERGTGSVSQRPGDERGDNGEGVRGRNSGENQEQERQGRNRPSRNGGDDSARTGRGRSLRHAEVTGHDYRITEEDRIGKGGAKEKARNNIAAIRLLKQIVAEGRPASAEEQAILTRYVGWGASELANGVFPERAWDSASRRSVERFKEDWESLGQELRDLLSDEEYRAAKASTLNAHYTSPGVIRGIWQAAQRLGFGKGRILEPGAGINLFLGLSPSELHASSRFTTVELDPISAGIAKLLYPTQDARHADFTKFSMPKGFYDLVIGNPPFADVKITSDPEYAKYKFSLHDYFFAKSMDLLRPGGIMALVTSRYTMDKANDVARAYLAKQADLVGAIRLPQTAFKENAGTEVVTDVLFLRKRLPGESVKTDPDGVLRNYNDNATRGAFRVQPWETLKEIATPDGTAYINEYFADHPEMVLGEHALTGSMYGGNQYTVEASKGDIEQAFADAVVKLPENVYTEPKIDSPAVQANVVDEVAPSNIKEGAYYLDDKGNLLQKEKGVGLEVKGKTGADIIRSFVTLRDAARAVLHAQLADLSDAELLTAQRDLNRAYDSFTDKHGLLNKARPISRVDKKTGEEKTSYTYPNFNAFRDDPDASFVMALEDYDAEKQTAKKTDIFSKRVIRPEVEPKVESVADALHVVLHETGKVDMTRIAEMMGLTEEQAAEGLGDLVYLDPESRLWQTDDEYLSGYVKDKLAFAQAAAELDKKFERNVKALEAVQPADKEPSKIQISLGMPIIKPEWIQQFARDVIDMGVRVNHVVQTGQWGVEKVSGWQGAGATSDYGTARRNAADLLDAALNKSQVAVHDTVVENGKERRVLNEDETRAANEKLQRIKDRFASWIWTNPERSVELARRYNDEYNNFVKREYGGKHIEAMTFPGVSAVKTPFDHQRRVAWRIVQRGNTYMAHSVGAGKTIASVLAGMELKRLGIKKKPMWVVPNHMLQQFSREFLELYPAAKIIVADETNFQKENRERFLGRVASQNWDGVIITHSAFKMIPMSGRFQAEYIQDQIEEIQDIIDWSDKKEDRIKIKQLERQRMRLEERLAKAMNSVGQGKGVTFEETGIDQIFVDEAHEFRKLDFATNQGNIKGIDPNGSDKAFDLYMKANYLEKLYPGRSLVLMSGTPITNTIGEIYSIQRFLQGNLLKKHGLHNFDAWASTFGDIKTSLEKDPAGNYKPVTRFARFRNMTQLQQMVADVFDSVHAKDLHYLKRPSVRTGGRQFVLTKESPAQKSFKLRLEERIKAIRKRRGPPKKGDDILLSVITDGRHAALADEYAGGASGPESKLGKAVDNIHLIWDATRKDKKTQMVFMDLGIAGAEDTRGFSAYVWMRDELVKKGIPAKEIAFMQDYKKSSDKQKLFNAMNRGDVRVLIGSSASMGTGVNAQKLLAALHHMDPDTYLPSNIEQREGRIVRQGNSNDEVDLFVYATKGSFDETMWQFIESKQRFIDNFLNGNEIADEVTDVDGAADDYALAKAMSSDNPLVLEQAGVQAEVERLESLQRAHQDEQYRLARVVDNAKAKIEELEKTVRRIEESAGKRIDTSGKLFTIEVDGKTFEERKDAGAYLADKLRAGIERKEETEYEIIGKLAGYDLQMNTYFLSGTKGTVGRSAAFLRLSDGANATPRVAVMDDEAADIDPVGLVVQLENKAKQFESDLKQAREDILKHEKALKDAKERVGQSFEYAEQLEDRKARLRQIEQELQQSEQTEAEGTEEPVRFALRPDMTNKEALPVLVERGVREYTPGMKYPEFAKRMKAALGDMWERFKGLMLKVWGEVRSSVVEITVPENMADLPDQEFIEKSKIFAREKFAGSKVTNRNDGSEILIPWQGIKHTFSGRITRAEAAAALNLSAMIERARLVRTETDYHGRRNIHTVFKYNVVAVVEGKAVKINITVREHDDGKRYYDHYEIKKRSAGQSGELAAGQESHQPFTERSTDSTLSPSGDDVKYALAATGYGLPVADIRSAFEPVYKNLPQAPPWRVVQTAAELPKRALDDAARRGIPPQRLLQAVYLGNEVVYVADHFRSIEEAKQVILEEVVVHHGLRGIMARDTYEKHMLQAALWYANKRTEEWKALGKTYGLDLKSRAGRIEAAEEMLGRDARTGKDSTMLNRIIAAVKEFLRSIGFDMGYGETEIRELLGKARRFVEGKESPAPSPQPRPGVIDYGALLRNLREQGITDEQLQAFAAYDPAGAKYAAAWHGSPHDFEKFLKSQIGTGEGAQAYGYGLYFAGKKEVAEHYKRKLSDYKVSVNGREVDVYTDRPTIESSALTQMLWEADGGTPDIDKTLTRMEEYAQRDFLNAEGKKNWRKQMQWLSENRDAIKVGSKGRLYQVELAPHEDEYLLWDKPLSEQSEKVKDRLISGLGRLSVSQTAMGKEILKNVIARKSSEGYSIYKILEKIFGSDRAASEYLHSLGIRGIKYLDGTSRGKGEGHHNYVIFDESDVSITAKFALARLQDVKGQIVNKGVSLNTTEREVLEADRAKAVEAIGETVKDYDEPGRFLFRAFYESDQDKAPGVVPYNPERGHYAAGENLKGSWWTTSLATAQEIAWSKARAGRPVKIVALPLDKLPNGNVYIQNTNPPGFVYDLFVGLPADVPLSAVREMPVDSGIRYALADRFAGYVGEMQGGEVWKRIARFLNPLDWSYSYGLFKNITPQNIQNGLARVLRDPIGAAEVDDDKNTFVEPGIQRERNKTSLLLRLYGWFGPREKIPNFIERFTKTFTSWHNNDLTTAWGRIVDEYGKLSQDDRKGVDWLLYRGDVDGKVYRTYDMAKGDKKVSRKLPSEAAFNVYLQVRTHIDTTVADTIEEITRQFMTENGMSGEEVEKHIFTYRQGLARHVGWLPRNHGEGNWQVNIYQRITGLKWDIGQYQATKHVKYLTKDGKTVEFERTIDALSAYLPYFPSHDVAKEIKILAKRFGLAYEQENGRQRVYVDKGAQKRMAKAVSKMKEKLAEEGVEADKREEMQRKLEELETTLAFVKDYSPGRQIQFFVKQAAKIIGKLESKNLMSIHRAKENLKQAIEDKESATEIRRLEDELEKLGDGSIKVKVYMRLQGSRRKADKHMKDIQRDMRKAIPENFRENAVYEVKVKFNDRISESTYGDMQNDFAQEQAQLKAIERASSKQEITKKEAAAIRHQIIQSTAEVLMARGAGAHRIQRAEYLIEGYDTENTLDAYQDYMTGTAGMLSKAKYAHDQFENFRYAKPEVKAWAEQYIRDTLRNMGYGDMVSGNLRSLASLAYLGFKVSSMVINATQPWTIGIAHLGMLTKRSPVKAMATAQKDIFVNNLTDDEKRIFASEIWKEQEQKTAVHEMAGSGEGATGKVSRFMHTLTGKALFGFQEVEMLNRKTVILAAYRTFRADGMEHGEALKKALEVNGHVNNEMSRANKPGIAQNPVGNTLFTLQSFTWRTWNWVFNRLTSGKKEDMIALLRYAAAMAIIGGVAALPGGDELDKLYQMLFGESPKLAFQKWTRKHAREYGSVAEMVNGFAWHGLASATGVNISNAMRLQIPIVSPLLSGDSLPEAAGGVFTGLAQKGARAVTAASRGDIYRMIENISPEALAGGMRAYRMATKGATTGTGKVIFDENGRPMKYGAGEAVTRALGFQPSRVSERNELTNVEKGLSAHWKEERGDLLAELRLSKPGEERRKVMLEIIKFNHRLNKSQAKGLIPVIKAQTIKQALSAKPNKSKAEWEREQLGG